MVQAQDVAIALAIALSAVSIHYGLWWLLPLWLAVKLIQQIRWSLTRLDFSGKIVFISGGSSGIGEQLAKDMVIHGAKKVIIAARRQQELSRVKSECSDPSKVQILQMDLSDPKACHELTARVFQEEAVDILINNGGVSMRECFESVDFPVAQRIMDINCNAHIGIISSAIPSMKSRRAGHIVNILSVAGLIGVPIRSVYSASKFGLSGFAKALRPELKLYGIRVNNFYPAYVQTDSSANALVGSGQTFNKVDSNIANGITASACSREIMRGIIRNQNEMVIGSLYYQLTPYVVNLLLPTFMSEHLLSQQLKSQMAVKQKAQ